MVLKNTLVGEITMFKHNTKYLSAIISIAVSGTLKVNIDTIKHGLHFHSLP